MRLSSVALLITSIAACGGPEGDMGNLIQDSAREGVRIGFQVTIKDGLANFPPGNATGNGKMIINVESSRISDSIACALDLSTEFISPYPSKASGDASLYAKVEFGTDGAQSQVFLDFGQRVNLGGCKVLVSAILDTNYAPPAPTSRDLVCRAYLYSLPGGVSDTRAVNGFLSRGFIKMLAGVNDIRIGVMNKTRLRQVSISASIVQAFTISFEDAAATAINTVAITPPADGTAVLIDAPQGTATLRFQSGILGSPMNLAVREIVSL